MYSTRTVKFNLVLISVLYLMTIAAPQDADSIITIPLNSPIEYNNREIHGQFITLKSYCTTQVKFTNISSDLGFIVFQAHSQFNSLVLYGSNDINNKIKGTNMGLLSVLKKTPKNQIEADVFYVHNPTSGNVITYISVHGYFPKDPLPGGCNMEFRVKRAPYLNVTTLTEYILVEAAPPSIDTECAVVNSAEVTFYMLYLPEMNFYAENYFDGIRRMMTLGSIQQYGIELPQTSVVWKMRRMVSAYQSIGVIFVGVARRNSNVSLYSVYVPSHTYGCTNILKVDCIFPDDTVTPLLCAILLFVGIFVTFYGHRFFKTEMFLAGFFSGFIITYILVDTTDTIDSIAASSLAGIFFGATWLLFWWLYGIPAIAVLLPSLNVGFIVAAIFYYRLPVNAYLQDDLNFWSFFIMIMVLTAVAMSSVPYSANILGCAILGGFCTMFAFDHFLGANQKYIIVNTLRRAVVPHFKYAVLSPPLQWRDGVVIVEWVLITLSGWAIQHWDNRGRAPFPPPPRNMRLAPPEGLNEGQVGRRSIRQYRRPPVVARNYTERSYLLADGNEQA